jgi:hypothetical protein
MLLRESVMRKRQQQSENAHDDCTQGGKAA